MQINTQSTIPLNACYIQIFVEKNKLLKKLQSELAYEEFVVMTRPTFLNMTCVCVVKDFN